MRRTRHQQGQEPARRRRPVRALTVALALVAAGAVPALGDDEAVQPRAAAASSRHDHGGPVGEHHRHAPRHRPGEELRVRKSVVDLTPAERTRFTDAVLALKRAPSPYDRDPSDGITRYYDQFVLWHKRLFACEAVAHAGGHRGMTSAHGGPQFLPWHRVYLLLFEDALREVTGEDVTVPYWDWADPRSTTVLFGAGFTTGGMLGGTGNPAAGYAVEDGPFRKGAWELTVQPEGAQWRSSGTPYLTRKIGFDPRDLPTRADIAALLAVPHYDTEPYDANSDTTRSFRSAVEGWSDDPASGGMRCGPDGWMTLLPGPKRWKHHNILHGDVGGILVPGPSGTAVLGTMAVPTSPNDPTFFLHHAYVDHLWAQWQDRHGRDTYQPESDADTVLEPFATQACTVTTPRSVADTTELGYRYR